MLLQSLGALHNRVWIPEGCRRYIALGYAVFCLTHSRHPIPVRHSPSTHPGRPLLAVSTFVVGLKTLAFFLPGNFTSCPYVFVIISLQEFHRLHVGDVLKFGESTRLYALEGPEELRPAEYESDNLVSRSDVNGEIAAFSVA